MTALKRIFTLWLAVALVVGSLLVQKLAFAAPTVSISQESARGSTPPSPKSARSSENEENNSSSSKAGTGNQPTPEQLQKHQKIIVY